MDKLTAIMAHKRHEIRGKLRQVSEGELSELADPGRPSFLRAIAGSNSLSVIAEIKRKSPSAGAIAPEASAVDQAALYAQAGADAVSVLTDEKYFSGTLDDLVAVTERFGRSPGGIPCLRKDFFLHPIQVVQAARAGASAILIIVRMLEQKEIRALYRAANLAGLDAIFEIHTEADLERAILANAKIVGVNNRNLATFSTDLAVSENLIPKIPPSLVSIAESGISTLQDVRRVKAVGAHATLIGQALMQHEDPESFIEQIHQL